MTKRPTETQLLDGMNRIIAEAREWLDGERTGDPALKRQLDQKLYSTGIDLRSMPTSALRKFARGALAYLYENMTPDLRPPVKQYIPESLALLSTGMQTKVAKGEKYGYMTFTLSLMPARKANGFFTQGRVNTCPMAGVCAKGCIDNTGQYRFSMNNTARLWRTHLLYACPTLFHELLDREIVSRCSTARKRDKRACFRLNTLSDLDWSETVRYHTIRYYNTRDADRPGNVEDCMEIGPEPWRSPLFYDYTKMVKRGMAILEKVPYYHLAFSKSERMPWAEAKGLVASGYRVAVVVDCKPKDEHPTVPGFLTADGDEHDLIFRAGSELGGCFITLAFKAGAQRGAALAASLADGFTAGVDRSTNTVIVQ